MPTISWDESQPTDPSALGAGAGAIRSLKTTLRTALDSEHVFPSGGGDAGAHRLGTVRTYVGTQSQVSSAGTDGKLMFTSDSSRLFHVGSGGTALIGSGTVINMGSSPPNNLSYPQRFYWAEECGAAVLNSQGSATVTIPGSGFSGTVYVYISQGTTGSSNVFVNPSVLNMSPSAFMITNALGSNGSDAAFFWRCVGTRIL